MTFCLPSHSVSCPERNFFHSSLRQLQNMTFIYATFLEQAYNMNSKIINVTRKCLYHYPKYYTFQHEIMTLFVQSSKLFLLLRLRISSALWCPAVSSWCSHSKLAYPACWMSLTLGLSSSVHMDRGCLLCMYSVPSLHSSLFSPLPLLLYIAMYLTSCLVDVSYLVLLSLSPPFCHLLTYLIIYMLCSLPACLH